MGGKGKLKNQIRIETRQFNVFSKKKNKTNKILKKKTENFGKRTK